MVVPAGAELSSAITSGQLFSQVLPLGLAALFLFITEEILARAESPVWRERKFVAWVNKKIVGLRTAGVVLVFLVYAYQAAWWYNTDMRELNAFAAGSAQVGKEFRRRADLVRNLDNIVKNYAAHERVLFEHVSTMRAQLQFLEMGGGLPAPAQGAKLEQAVMSLTALAEQYPDLKAEQRFHELMDAVETSEDRIAEKLVAYLAAAMDFNTCNQHFWCNYWTFFGVAQLVPMPAFFEFYYSDGKTAPLVPDEGADLPRAEEGEIVAPDLPVNPSRVSGVKP